MTDLRTAGVTTRDRVGLAAVLAATFMGQVDGFIVTVAAPSLQRDCPPRSARSNSSVRVTCSPPPRA